MVDDKGDKHEFSDDEWRAVSASVGGFNDVAVIEYGHGPGDFWFADFGPPPFEIDHPVERKAMDSDIRSNLEGRLWFAKESSLGHFSSARHDEGADRVRKIAEQSNKLIELLSDHRKARVLLDPRQADDPLNDLDFLDEDLTIFVPKLQVYLIKARDFYHRLAASYDQSALDSRINVRPTDVCREIYWGELVQIWTRVLRRPPTSSPTGPLTRFIEAASAPMSKRLLPSADTIHRFARNRLRPMQDDVG